MSKEDRELRAKVIDLVAKLSGQEGFVVDLAITLMEDELTADAAAITYPGWAVGVSENIIDDYLDTMTAINSEKEALENALAQYESDRL